MGTEQSLLNSIYFFY